LGLVLELWAVVAVARKFVDLGGLRARGGFIEAATSTATASDRIWRRSVHNRDYPCEGTVSKASVEAEGKFREEGEPRCVF
jgi:hypothetical protein